MFRFLLYIFLIYLAYQFIYNFLLPVFRTTQQVKKGFREMHERMNASQEQNQPTSPANAGSQTTQGEKNKVGEYIDFEDVK